MGLGPRKGRKPTSESLRFEEFRVYVRAPATVPYWSASFRTRGEATSYERRLHAKAAREGVTIRTAVLTWSDPIPPWWSQHFTTPRPDEK
jgi:hypothetical protein